MKIAVIGATGSIGPHVVRALSASDLPITELRLFDDAPGREWAFEFRGTPLATEPLSEAAIAGTTFAINFGDDATAIAWNPAFRAAGAIVIDHSTPTRMDASVPIAVAHLNDEFIRRTHTGTISSPNCATVILALALAPLHENFGIARAVITTFQAITGAGWRALAEFETETAAVLGNLAVPPRTVFPKPIAFNAQPKIGDFDAAGNTDEEVETESEIGRLFPGIRMTATCVRIPVRNAHGIAVNLEFANPVSRESAMAALRDAPCIRLAPTDADFPTPADVSGDARVHVGRVRVDASVPHGLNMWVVGDNLVRGTSANAVDLVRALAR